MWMKTDKAHTPQPQVAKLGEVPHMFLFRDILCVSIAGLAINAYSNGVMTGKSLHLLVESKLN